MSGKTHGTAHPVEPPRIQKFRRELLKAIPRVPNDRAALRHMQQKHLTDLMNDYLSWRARYVAARPRQVIIEPSAKANPRWSTMSALVDAFLEKVRGGDDLTPHLSVLPHTRGYAVAANSPGSTPDDKWSDKDFFLNTMGYHHFHLDAADDEKGHWDGPDDLIFAAVTRETFTVIGLFTHDVFEPNSAERMRLCAIHDEIVFRGMSPGAVVASACIALSGHDTGMWFYARKCSDRMAEYEPKLDDAEFVRGLYKPKSEAPPRPKPEWVFWGLDLAIYDRAKPGLLVVEKGRH